MNFNWAFIISKITNYIIPFAFYFGEKIHPTDVPYDVHILQLNFLLERIPRINTKIPLLIRLSFRKKKNLLIWTIDLATLTDTDVSGAMFEKYILSCWCIFNVVSAERSKLLYWRMIVQEKIKIAFIQNIGETKDRMSYWIHCFLTDDDFPQIINISHATI